MTLPDPETTAERVVVLDVVGLQPGHLDPEQTPNLTSLLGTDGAATAPLEPRFPALTVPAQTTLATGQPPGVHGDVASGEYDRERDAVAFWERDRVDRTRIWESAREDEVTTGALFFQHLIGTTADVAVTPSPIEDENNQLIEMDCWTNPDGYYDDLREQFGHFPLHNYWGPGAGAAASEWILDAATDALGRFDPELLWVYVPHLDYAGLAEGPDSEAFAAELEVVDELVGDFLADLRESDRWAGTAVVVLSEYGFHSVERPVFPNRALREAGLLETGAGADDNDVDIPGSEAFAMVDHQVAHVYADSGAVHEAREILASLPGVDTVIDDGDKQAWGIDHPNAGDLVLVADADAWFQYYWWEDLAAAPAYATEVEIHEKPGFDPCELFVGEEGMVSTDPTKVGGSHGRVDEETYPLFGVGGPAAPEVTIDGTVDALAVTPFLADLVGAESAAELAGGPGQ